MRKDEIPEYWIDFLENYKGRFVETGLLLSSAFKSKLKEGVLRNLFTTSYDVAFFSEGEVEVCAEIVFNAGEKNVNLKPLLNRAFIQTIIYIICKCCKWNIILTRKSRKEVLL